MKEPAQEKSIVWLHLSDLHLCKLKTGWDAHRVLSGLKPDLKVMEATYGLSPQFIFFTGDAAFGQLGKKKGEKLADQFEDAHQLFEGIRKAFKKPVPRSNVFLVPGNHDVDRNQAKPDQTNWLDNQTDPKVVTKLIQTADVQWVRYMHRLNAYRTFLTHYGYTHLLKDTNRLICAEIRKVQGMKIGIACLNTAWSCCRDSKDEKAKLWLGGDWQVGELTAKLQKVDFRIALTHHPLNWFSEREDPIVLRLIEREFAFYLHGHEHQGWVDQKADGHVRLAAAACYDRSEKENGYNFVRLNLETGLGEVWLRRYDPSGGGWIPRAVANKTGEDGRWPLNHLACLKKPRPHSIPPENQEFPSLVVHGYKEIRIQNVKDAPPIILPWDLPEMSKKYGQKATENAKYWKRVHTLSEDISKVFQQLYRVMSQYRSKSEYQPDSDDPSLKQTVNELIEGSRTHLKRFSFDVGRLPEWVCNAEHIVVMLNACKGIDALARSATFDSNTEAFQNALHLVERICHWSSECLTRADRVLEVYFDSKRGRR